MKARNKKILAIATLILLLLFGFFQERFKVAVNYYIDVSESIPGFYDESAEQRGEWILQSKTSAKRSHDYYYSHETFNGFNRLSRNTMISLKWGGTLFFTIVHLITIIFIIRLWFEKNKYRNWVILMYLLLAVIAVGIFLFGKVINEPQSTYAIARKIMGALQSAVPLMIIIPGIWLYENLDKD